ncbi:MAG: FtsX-like permease family protein, partial [Trebonia sp.]
PAPGGPVDNLTLDEGHWPENNGQMVAARGAAVFPGSTVRIGKRSFTVVGVAESVTQTADAWVLPPAAAGLASSAGLAVGRGQAEMLYRFASAGSPAEVAADIASVRAALPRGALLNTVPYLEIRQSEEGSIAPWVPFIVAFGVIALVISVLIVVNVVSGAVIAGITRIGVLKSIGFTPAQVVAAYVLLIAVPSLIGCLAGAILGNLLAMPMLKVNARVYGVGALGVPAWVDVAVPLAAFTLTVLGAVPPALQAGRLSVVEAITSGRAPRAAHGYRAQRLLGRLSVVPRAVTLGLASPFARPGRTAVTLFAIFFGAAAVTFGIGLAVSLNRVVADNPNAALPVQVSLLGAGPKASGLTTAQRQDVTGVLSSQRDTLHIVPETDAQVSLPGVAGSASVTAYGADPAWSGLTLISGRWYSGPAQADVNTLFLTDTGTAVGSEYTFDGGGHRTTIRIVGEVFDPGKRIDVYLSPASLAALSPGAGAPRQYDMALRPGSDPQAYANAVSVALGRSYAVSTSTGVSGEFQAVLTLIAMLTVLIAVVSGLGVLNTVALQIRERAHDIGVFKALGLTPRQTLSMITSSVGLIGLIGGVLAVPAGVYLHHAVVPVMAHAANSGYPPSMISVYSAWSLIALGVSGLLIAVLGALGPAGWAARARTAFALRAE